MTSLSTARSPEYRAYHDAKQRCNNPNHKRYLDWGGRGIKFLFSSFHQFYEYLGPRPDGYSIDRIDNNGHYEIGNVQWSSRQTQQLNKRVSGVRQVKSKGLVAETWQAYVNRGGEFHQLYTGPSKDAAIAARKSMMEQLRASNARL